MITLTPNSIFAFASLGTAWSLVLEYLPKLNTWYNALPDNVQRLVVLGSGAVLVLGAFGLNCLQVIVPAWACSVHSLSDVLFAYGSFVFASQATYLVTPKKA